jgi:hypothetical protein
VNGSAIPESNRLKRGWGHRVATDRHSPGLLHHPIGLRFVIWAAVPMPVFVGCYICPLSVKNAQPPTSARSFAGGDKPQSSSSLVEFAGNGPANHRRSWGHFVQVNSDLGRGVNEGISANAIHHISAAMIAGYQNNIGMTDLLSRKTPTSDQSSRRSRRGDRAAAPFARCFGPGPHM